MKRVTMAVLMVAALSLAGHEALLAQTPATTPPGGAEDSALARRTLSGPRFGITTFTGDVAKHRQAQGKEVMMTQFGWQFETQIASRETSHQGLLEWVVLVGGVEQSELNLSLSWLAGFRMPGGFEIGAGPAVSTHKDDRQFHTSMVMAAGATAPFGDFHIPLHAAVALAEGGPRITTLVGWIVH